MAIFSQEEITRRRKVLSDGMKKADIHCAFVWTPFSVYYLTGLVVMDLWGRPNVAILRHDGQCCLIVSAGELLNAETNAWVDQILPYGDARNVLAAIQEMALDVLFRMGCERKRLAVEMDEIPLGIASQLRDKLGCPELADVDPILADARIIKSSEEVALLKIGGEAAKTGMQACLDSLSESCTEADVAAAGQAAMHKYIAAHAPSVMSSSFAYCNGGLNTLVPHLHPTGRKIQTGDLVGLNVFPVAAGYLMELERTLIFGTCTPEQERVLQVVGEAFSAGKRAVANGVRACEVYQVTRRIRETRGFGEYTRGGAGHSHGIMIATNGREELGEIRPYNTAILRSGMVVSIEPGIYIPKVGAFRHSDVLLVTEHGSEVLTEFEAPISLG